MAGETQSTPTSIRITREEAMSEHAETLLRRQMSLRGEQGITAMRRRHWFYQSWFILLVAGAAGALAAWAIIEPYFDDETYVQGTIAQLNTTDPMPQRISVGSQYLDLSVPGQGWVEINGVRIWLLKNLREYGSGGTGALDPTSLKKGQEVGVYVEVWELEGQSLAFGRFVDPSPPPQSAGRAALTLRQLSSRSRAAGLLLFPLVAGLIGLMVGAADGVVCRLARRAILGGAVGFLAGFIGGFVSSIVAGLAYAPLNRLAEDQMDLVKGSFTTFGFLVQMTGRGLAWLLAGMAMGLGPGLVLRSRRLLLYGFLGGIIGGLLGGLLFDPIDLLVLGLDKPTAHWARLIGLTTIGAAVGAMIGVVELLARDAWMRMTDGPLVGKEFLLFKDTMQIGSSPRSDIYLFNDPQVAAHHATLRAVGDGCEVEAAGADHTVLVNRVVVRRSRLRHGDQVTIGRTSFVFQRRQG